MAHYILVYEIDNNRIDYLAQDLDPEILTHLAMLLAYRKSFDESISICNCLVFGSPHSIVDLCNDIEKYFRKYMNFILARIKPIENIDSGYKPRTNVDKNREKREKLKVLLNKYKTYTPKELIENLTKWNF